MTSGREPRRWILPGLVAIAIVPPLLHPWLCDDIFITFRYVQRAFAGQGLTFNPGEHVEGYTHFLWAILLWALHALGFDLEALGRWLPLPFYAASVAVLGLASAQLFAARAPRAWGVPVAALLWALHREAHVFASGGLETAAYTFCLVLGFYLVTVVAPRVQRATLAGAAAYALAALLRPEGLVHLCLALAWVAARDRRAARGFAGVALALLAPLWIWRWLYYHDVVPNAFHAKSASHPYWSQGWIYVGLYFRYYAALVVSLVGIVMVLRRPGEAFPVGERAAASRVVRAPLFLATAHALVVVVMTAWVGGDFMFGRFLLPATPFLCLLCEHAVLALPRGVPAAVALLAAAVVGGGFWRERSLHGINVATHGIADERSQYPPELLATRRRQGELLAHCFADTRAVFLLQGSQASFAYYGHLPVAIEAYGLTDRTIARVPLAHRGRPGHERQPPLDYLLQRGTNFLIHLPGAKPQREFARIDFGDLLGEIVVYDRTLMEHVHGCDGIRFTEFPAYFDAWAERAAALDAATLQRDADAFHLYYFDHNSDPQRAARLAALLQARAGG